MILEAAILNVRPGESVQFEQAFAQVRSIITSLVCRIIFLTNSIATLKLTTRTCYWFTGDGSKITPKAFATQPSIRNGNTFCIISTSRFPRSNITREYDARMLIEVLL